MPKRTPRLHPPDLRASSFELDGQEFLVLSYALPHWDLPAGLTESERVVVLAVLAGKSQQEIASARGTSPRTVANQLRSAFVKLGVSSKVELAAKLKRIEAKEETRPT